MTSSVVYLSSVRVPDKFLARGGDEPLRGVDLALLAVSLEHLEADALARGVEVIEVDAVWVVESARALARALALECSLDGPPFFV
eukprot:scaffold588_cov152-Isochrysis_galbana.AAC.1